AYNVEAIDSLRTLTGLNNLTVVHAYPWTHRTDQVQVGDPTLNPVLGTSYNFDNAERMATRYHGSVSNPDTARTFIYGNQGNLVRYVDTLHTGPTCTPLPCGYDCHSGTASFVGATSYVYDSLGN